MRPAHGADQQDEMTELTSRPEPQPAAEPEIRVETCQELMGRYKAAQAAGETEVTGTVRVRIHSFDTRTTRKGSEYDLVRFGDRTRVLEAKDFRRRLDSMGRPDYALLTVKVEAYNGGPSAILDGAEALTDVDPDEFIDFDREANARHRAELVELVQSMNDGPYKLIVSAALSAEAGHLDAYCSWPAAKRNHHAYKGGLLEHSLEVARYALALCELDGEPYDRDLLIAGCLLHDIGKLDEYDAPPALDWGLAAGFIGHVAAGQIRLGAAVQTARLSGYDIAQVHVYRLAHMIEMHHGMARLDTGRSLAGREVRALAAADEYTSKLHVSEREQAVLDAAQRAMA